MDDITSEQNQHVKDAAKLRERRERRKQGRTLIDGAREVRRAIEAGVELVEVFLCDSLCKTSDCRWVLERLATLPVRQSRVTPAVFEKLAFGDRAEGVLAIATTPERSLADLKLPANPLVAVLEGVEKPGNIGAVLRSADAAGVSALVIADGGTDLFNPNTIRASLGTIFTMPVCSAPAAAVRDWLIAQQIGVFVARVDAKTVYTEANLTRPAAIVLGSEAEGLSQVWSGPKTTTIRLPMRGAGDSLNVSAAAAVLFYEALRQREPPKGRK
ncbi:MAG TPA: TrmH family RNA methyltransferase [Pirellulales bacterium]|jgi:TrmH family RNA methyltransferase|nr:TrmH family RNA methyltransferase [Pirellulales bacterium]